MSAYLARRVAKLEGRHRKRIHVPNVVGQFEGETREQAWARFAVRYGDAIPNPHHVLFVPQYRSRDDFAAQFKQQQTRLLSEVRSQRPREEEAL